MPRRTFAPVLGALLALAAAQVMASGFGRMTNATVLGQRLDFSVPLQLDGGQKIGPECVTAEVLAGEFRVMPSAVDVAVVPGREAGERLIRVVTDTAIDEPVVTVTVQVGCSSPMTRRFVAFIDPPMQAPARAEAARWQTLATTPAATPVAPPAAARTGSPSDASSMAAASPAPAADVPPPPGPRKARRSGTKTATAAARPKSQGAARKDSAVAAAKPRPAKASPRVAAAAPSTPVAKGPRLQLDAAPIDVMLAQTQLRLTDSVPSLLPVAVAAAQDAASAAAGAEITAQRERLAALEASLAKLRADAQATQASLAQLQSQLRESQAQRYANPVVYALLAICVLLGAAVVALWRSRAAERRQAAQWWAPAANANATAAAADAAEAMPRPAPGPVAVPPEQWDAPESMHGETTASSRLLEPAAPVPSAAESEREMSVDELIDLEQQADFFVVLGQDDAAIELLTSHLRSSGGTSPLPYLKLLEIYRRLNDREAYERTRDKFNRRFNAHAPDWDADLQQGRALEDYAPVVARLQSLWTSPGLAMRALETSLFRRDAAASTFELPAYRELLFLYSVARDLSEQEARPSDVDVLLPFDAEESGGGTFTRLHPTRPMPIAADPYTTQVDVDITSLDAGPPAPDDPPSRFVSDFGTTSGDVRLSVERFATSR
ncbi:MAG TPA: hypothetical protein PKC97_15430 [Burkholderiaceae bacterium]|nr:hypothetical protein [Burkholderiaceae bacterium]